MSYFSFDSVSAGYGKFPVLKGVSISAEKGEAVAIIGSNGAGKSTLLRAASRMIPSSSGKIVFNGKDITECEPHTLPASGLAHVPEGRRIFSRLTILENLELGAFTQTDAAKIQEQLKFSYDLFPILYDRRNQLGGTLSGGEQQMLALCRALMSRPSLLLLDEPSMGVAPIFVEKIFAALKTLHKEGITIILVEQNASAALSFASKGYVLKLGEITASGSGSELLADPIVKASYLGE